MKTRGMTAGKVYYGDCLRNMRRWVEWNRWNAPILADLIYLDPPWNSNANYNVLFDKGKQATTGHTAQVAVFEDIWVWNEAAQKRLENLLAEKYHPARNYIQSVRSLIGDCGMLSYLTFMAERLALCHLLLKETGSIYLHCDPFASHYLKLLMDDIFGIENFRNEIVWKRTSSRMAKHKHPSVHDTIFFYAKEKHQLNKVFSGHTAEYINKFYRHQDDFGSYMIESLAGPGITKRGDSGKPWRGVDPTKVKRHWAMPGTFPSHVVKPADWDKMPVHEKLDYLDSAGLIYWPRKTGGIPRFKRYLSTSKGRVMTDMILDVPPLSAQSKEKLGYPTQKPLPLLERIIKASSDDGDLVLDPFCGCGTTLEAAKELGREFVGIDVSLFSVKSVVLERLRGLCEIGGIPEDLASWKQLEKEDCYAFEALAVEQCCDAGMKANLAQSRDGGVDGYGRLLNDCDGKDLVVAQVKSSRKGRKPALGMVRDFATAMRMEDAVAGIFITMRRKDWTEGMQKVADSMGKFHVGGSAAKHPRMQHWSVEQYFENKKYNQFAYLPDLANPLKKGKEPFQFQKEPLFRGK